MLGVREGPFVTEGMTSGVTEAGTVTVLVMTGVGVGFSGVNDQASQPMQ